MKNPGWGFWMRHVVAGLAGSMAAAVFSVAAAAADFTPLARSSDWTVTLGAEGRVLPSFSGSDRYVLRPVPLLDIRRAGTPRRFSSPRDGFGFGLIESGSFRFGPTAKLRLPRKESDDARLRGLGDVNWAVELGVFAEYWPVQWLRTRAEVRQGIGGHRGIVSDLTADVVHPVTGQLTLSVGPRVTLVSAAANRPYFSIDAVQSAASGLPVFDARGGLYSYGAGAQARYEWTRQWATHVFVEYERLTRDAANSPLVLQRGAANQTTVGAGATYSFDVPGLW
jgi:outer membrane protein